VLNSLFPVVDLSVCPPPPFLLKSLLSLDLRFQIPSLSPFHDLGQPARSVFGFYLRWVSNKDNSNHPFSPFSPASFFSFFQQLFGDGTLPIALVSVPFQSRYGRRSLSCSTRELLKSSLAPEYLFLTDVNVPPLFFLLYSTHPSQPPSSSFSITSNVLYEAYSCGPVLLD